MSEPDRRGDSSGNGYASAVPFMKETMDFQFRRARKTHADNVATHMPRPISRSERLVAVQLQRYRRVAAPFASVVETDGRSEGRAIWTGPRTPSMSPYSFALIASR